jgi:pimeloyl-ACP methyl ester carboxylesterase
VPVITIQAHAEQQERALYPPPGELVDIGGGQLIHLRTWEPPVAPTANAPTIVLDVSASMPLTEWAWIAPALAAKGHRVVAYDRPGMGWSRGPWQPRDSARAADALAKTLTTAGISPPYIVVGHSFGGFSVRVFAGSHTEDVKGLVLLDTTHPDGGGEVLFATWFRVRAWQGHAGYFHIWNPVDNWFSSLPIEDQGPSVAVSRWTSHLDTTAEELEAWHTSAAQVRAASLNLHGIPLLVVAGLGSENHLAQQRDIASISKRSTYVEIGSDHMGMLVQEWQTPPVLEAIEEFLASL